MADPTAVIDGDVLVVSVDDQSWRLSLALEPARLDAWLDYQESDERPSWRAELARVRDEFMSAEAREVLGSIPDGFVAIFAARQWIGALNTRLGKLLTSSLAGAAPAESSPPSSAPASASPRTKQAAKA